MAESSSSAPKPDSKAATFTPSKFDWADEVTTPVRDSDKNLESAQQALQNTSLDHAQTDGATQCMNGTAGLDEPEFDVNVKLADLQADPNNPLYSVKSFDELQL